MAPHRLQNSQPPSCQVAALRFRGLCRPALAEVVEEALVVAHEVTHILDEVEHEVVDADSATARLTHAADHLVEANADLALVVAAPQIHNAHLVCAAYGLPNLVNHFVSLLGYLQGRACHLLRTSQPFQARLAYSELSFFPCELFLNIEASVRILFACPELSQGALASL